MIPSLYKPFQHWAEKGSIYIVSDTHFDDIDREYMGYTISSQEQFDIIKKRVHKNDTLIHLGDVGNPRYLLNLRCYKVLIKGNHDVTGKTIPHLATDYDHWTWDSFFHEVYNGPLMISPKILLSHEPINIPWAINIHGHDHSGASSNTSINLAPPHAGYEPYNLKEEIKKGLLTQINDIHRLTIDYQTAKKIQRNS